MNVFCLSAGIILFAVMVSDIIKTTFSSNGGGRITNLVSRAVWNIFFLAAGKKGRSRLLEYAGPAALISVLLVWITGLWAGMFVALLSDADSVINSTTKASTGAVEKFYYAGFTLSTLGIGDYIASDNFWRIVTNVAAYSGLVFITASITYFVPVLSAVGLQSKLSLYIYSMGRNPQQILANSWNGKDFSSFFDNTSDLCQMLMQHTMNHHSYPVIHYFHNIKPKLAILPAIVLLDETCQLLTNAVSQDAALNRLKVTMLETTLNSYLEMVKESYLKNAKSNLKAPVPDLNSLEKIGIPLQKDDIAYTLRQKLQQRRELFSALLEMHGWTWAEVYQS